MLYRKETVLTIGIHHCVAALHLSESATVFAEKEVWLIISFVAPMQPHRVCRRLLVRLSAPSLPPESWTAEIYHSLIPMGVESSVTKQAS